MALILRAVNLMKCVRLFGVGFVWELTTQNNITNTHVSHIHREQYKILYNTPPTSQVWSHRNYKKRR